MNWEFRKQNRFSTKVRASAVRKVLGNQADYQMWSECFRSIFQKMKCSLETLQNWVSNRVFETGIRKGLTLSERVKMKEFQRENYELKQANKIPQCIRLFRDGGPRSPMAETTILMDNHLEMLITWQAFNTSPSFCDRFSKPVFCLMIFLVIFNIMVCF